MTTAAFLLLAGLLATGAGTIAVNWRCGKLEEDLAAVKVQLNRIQSDLSLEMDDDDEDDGGWLE